MYISEYGVGSEVSTYGDVYSFGIILLEMLTGRRPTDEMFEDGQNIHNFVAFGFIYIKNKVWTSQKYI